MRKTKRIIDPELTLVPYYPNEKAALHWQNQHIGRRVIGELISIAREKGIPTLRAEIYAFNTQSQAMFHRCGFHPVDETHWELDV